MQRMCYSAQIIAGWRKYVRKVDARISIEDFRDLIWLAERDKKVKVPRAIDLAFVGPQDDAERELWAAIDKYRGAQVSEFEQELFKQRKRLADAERELQAKATKKATESRRIAGDKVEWLLGKLADLKRTEPKGRDARIFPGWYVPVIVVEGGQRVVKPMRYQCRPAGKPAFYDTKYPGTYNARRDNLEGFWKGQFGHTHGVMVAERFFENVQRDGKNVVLEFTPNSGEPMLVACLWSRWTAPGESDLLSFAAITDEPPPEVAAAGHDRCIIPIKPEHLDAWLSPERADKGAMYAILDDRERPYYEHRLAA